MPRPRPRLVGDLCVRGTLLDCCKIRHCRTLRVRFRLHTSSTQPSPTSTTSELQAPHVHGPSLQSFHAHPILSFSLLPRSFCSYPPFLDASLPHAFSFPPDENAPINTSERMSELPLACRRVGRVHCMARCPALYTLCVSSPNGPPAHDPFLPHPPSTRSFPPPSRFMPYSGTMRLYPSITLVLPPPSSPFRTSAHPLAGNPPRTRAPSTLPCVCLLSSP
ncbi:hypothetical protein B0H14DRAFT_2876183 [Mycena olivaceomarginata]|nr:hypothetical protein B0H14DRAFT_2876183 [Mycena olivaceomarginata]